MYQAPRGRRLSRLTTVLQARLSVSRKIQPGLLNHGPGLSARARHHHRPSWASTSPDNTLVRYQARPYALLMVKHLLRQLVAAEVAAEVVTDQWAANLTQTPGLLDSLLTRAQALRFDWLWDRDRGVFVKLNAEHANWRHKAARTN